MCCKVSIHCPLCKHFCSTSFLASAPQWAAKIGQIYKINAVRCSCSKLIISAPGTVDNASAGEGCHPLLSSIESGWNWKFEVIGGVGFQVVVPGPPLSALIGLHSVAPREADQLHYPQHRITSQRSLISLISHQINWALPSLQSQQWREMSSEQFQAQLLQWKRVEKKCAKIAEV